MPQVVIDPLLNVTGISQLHHDTQGLRAVIKKRLAIVDNIGMSDRGENPDLV